MLRQLSTKNTAQIRKFFGLTQAERSVNHLCASKLIKSDEYLISREVIMPMPIKLPNGNYCTTQSIKKKKVKKVKPHPRAVEHVGRLDMRVGRIIEVDKSPYADTLYLTKVDIGDNETRSIVVGLAKLIPADQLLNLNVVVLCNIKPAELRGHSTHGMIMCAECGDDRELLTPPSNAEPGDLVYCENFERDPVELPRKKMRLFDPIASDLHTNGRLVACYQSSFLFIPDKGKIVVKSLKNANISKFV